MTNYESWFTSKKEKIQIDSITIYKNLSSEIVKKLDENLSVGEIVKWIRSETQEAFRNTYGKNPETGSLNNAVGRWNEFIATTMLSEIAIDLNKTTDSSILIFSIPNSSLQKDEQERVSSSFLNLFNRNEFAEGKSLAKLRQFKNQILMSSPDYVITINQDTTLITSISNLLNKQAREPEKLDIYHFLEGKLHIQDLKAVASLKTSNRPDRRYQPLFEAATIKAISYSLNQNWKYYMVASELTPADRTIFDIAIAPHGIVLNEYIKLVDGTYPYSKKEDLVKLVEDCINS
jgi:Cfr10I/Bse634I restriction endonuclease